jgi:hypothetical protein
LSGIGSTEEPSSSNAFQLGSHADEVATFVLYALVAAVTTAANV